MTSITPQQVREFWFVESGPERWFEKDPAFDQAIRFRFAPAMAAAREGRLDDWQTEPLSCLAFILLIDQFSRNVFRLSPLAWSADWRALAAAKHALAEGFDADMNVEERKFLYMPFMHSEVADDQRRCVELFSDIRDADPERGERSYTSALRHCEIVERFGRFPHRNEVLGRPSSEEEIAFLLEPHSSF